MQNPVSNVALTPSLPVDVLIKSAPAIMHTREACITFCMVPHSPVARMTFMCASPQASRISRVSLMHQNNERCEEQNNDIKQRNHTLVKLSPVARENQRPRHNHIDFRRARRDSSSNFGQSLLQRGLAGGETSGDRGDGDASAFKGRACLTNARGIDANSAYSNLALLYSESGDDILANGKGGLEAEAIDVGLGIVTGQSCQINALHSTKQPCRLPFLLNGTDFQRSDRRGTDLADLGSMRSTAASDKCEYSPFPLEGLHPPLERREVDLKSCENRVRQKAPNSCHGAPERS